MVGVTGRILGLVDVVRQSGRTGWADFRAVYTVRTWTFGWLTRVLSQVVFFALIGRLIGSHEAEEYLVVGNSIMIVAFEACYVVAATAWGERISGTLPLLVAAPASPLLVFFGRNLHWILSGTTTSLIAFFGLGALFGVTLPFPSVLAVVPLVLLIGISTYCLALTLGALALRAIGARNIIGNLAQLTLMAFCGVQVPVSYWPVWIQYGASVLPVTHGLRAVRMVLDGAVGWDPLGEAALELAVGTGWLAVAALTFRRLVEGGRRRGTIEFGG